MSSMQSKSHLIIIFIIVLLYLIGFGLMIPIMPMIAKEFGASAFEIGLLMASYSLMQFLFAPFWGRLSDQYGRRSILLICLLGESLSYVFFALSQNFWGLILARSLAGIFGGSISAASASISDVTESSERSRGMTIIGTAFGLGFAIGPALGGGLSILADFLFPGQSTHFNMRFSSISVAFICLVTFAFAWGKLKETVHLKKISTLDNNPLKDLSRIELFGRFLRKPITGTFIISFFLNTFAMALMEATLVLFVVQRFNWGLKEVFFGFSYIGLLGAFNQGVIVRSILPLLGERILLITGLGLYVISYLMIGFSDSIPFLAIALTIFSIGNSFVSPVLLGVISLTTNSQEQGEALGTAQSMASLARISGPMLGGALYDVLNLSAPFWGSSLVTLFNLWLILGIRAKIPISAKKQNNLSDVDYVGAFQLNNLIYNRVPFILLSDQTHFEELYQGLELDHLKNIMIIVDFNLPEFQWVEKIKSHGFSLYTPLVILKSEGPISFKSLKRLKKVYPGNIYIVNQSWLALKKELLSNH